MEKPKVGEIWKLKCPGSLTEFHMDIVEVCGDEVFYCPVGSFMALQNMPMVVLMELGERIGE